MPTSSNEIQNYLDELEKTSTQNLSHEEILKLYNRQTKIINLIMKQSDRQTKQLLELNEKLTDAANTDPMTGAHNRRYFFDIAKNFISISRREKQELGVAMIDIDKFKNINDTHGHDVGDIIIKSLTNQVNDILRDSDVFARFGGEEFVIMLPNTDLEGTSMVCEKIRKAIEDSKPYDEILYTVSIGVSTYNNNDDSIEQSIKRADSALYAAKESGRNKIMT